MPELRRSNRVANKQQVSYASDSEEEHSQPPQKKVKQEDDGLAIGQPIPDITLKDEDDEDINLLDILKKSTYLVLFAYPKASTPGCTRQVNGFEKNYTYYKTNNVQIFGISADSPQSQKKFKEKFGLQYKLLSDPGKELIAQLGAKKSPSGIKRSHWIFKNGELLVKKLQISPEVSIDSSLTDIEQFLKGEEKEENDDENDDVKEEGNDEKHDVNDENDEKDDVKDEENDDVAQTVKQIDDEVEKEKENADDLKDDVQVDAKPSAE